MTFGSQLMSLTKTCGVDIYACFWVLSHINWFLMTFSSLLPIVSLTFTMIFFPFWFGSVPYFFIAVSLKSVAGSLSAAGEMQERSNFASLVFHCELLWSSQLLLLCVASGWTLETVSFLLFGTDCGNGEQAAPYSCWWSRLYIYCTTVV